MTTDEYLICGAALAALLATILLLSRLRLPRPIYGAISLACFLGSFIVAHRLHPWNHASAWPGALQAGLIGLTVGTLGLAFPRRHRAQSG